MAIFTVLSLCQAGCQRERPDQGQEADAEPVVLRLGHASLPGKPLFETVAAFKQCVQKNSRGRVRIEVYPQGQLGDSRLLTESVAVGTLDMTCEAPLSPIVPEMALLELPYLFADTDEAAENLEEAFGQALAERAERRGIVVLGYYAEAGRNIFNRDRAVCAPDDLAGLKIRVPEGSVWLEMMNRFGAMATPLSWGEVYSAIEQGVIDGAETDLISIERACLYECCKHVSLTGHVFTVYPHIINRKRYESLPSDVRELLREACLRASRRQRRLLHSRLAEARKRLESHGVSIVDVDREQFRRKVLSMHGEYARRLGAEGIMSLLISSHKTGQTERISRK